jgi:hypothetical protein
MRKMPSVSFIIVLHPARPKRWTHHFVGEVFRFAEFVGLATVDALCYQRLPYVEQIVSRS